MLNYKDILFKLPKISQAINYVKYKIYYLLCLLLSICMSLNSEAFCLPLKPGKYANTKQNKNTPQLFY